MSEGDGSTSPSLKGEVELSKPWVTPEGNMREVTLELDERKVQHFRNVNRMVAEPRNWPGGYFNDYVGFWVWEGGSEQVQAVIDQIHEAYEGEQGTSPTADRDYAAYLKSFVDSFSYTADDQTIGYEEYGKFPIETLYDGEGDCDCLTFLLAALFTHAGFETAYLEGYTEPGRQGRHAAVGLDLPTQPGDDTVSGDGTEWIYCEPVDDEPVGRCAWPISIFQRHAMVVPVPESYDWPGRPGPWTCGEGCNEPTPPDVMECRGCGRTGALTDVQRAGHKVLDFEDTVDEFLTWMDWVEDASAKELLRELERIQRTPLWKEVPDGNRGFLEDTVDRVGAEDGEDPEDVDPSGIRSHLLRAWPHVAASVFSHDPEEEREGRKAYGGMEWLGKSVYEMDNEELALFSKKVLTDTTLKRVEGFSGGSRSAIGSILEAYERRSGQEAEEYLDRKRESIENILVKVVIPQVFSLLAREHETATA